MMMMMMMITMTVLMIRSKSELGRSSGLEYSAYKKPVQLHARLLPGSPHTEQFCY